MPFIFWGTYLYHEIVAVFIPIAGRSGANENPDINIGLITCFFTMFIGSYLVNNESFMNDYFLNVQLSFILYEYFVLNRSHWLDYYEIRNTFRLLHFQYFCWLV